MVGQTTFRSTARPVLKRVTTDLAGVLDFSGRATSLEFTSGQSLPFTSISNNNHLMPGFNVELYNKTPASIFLASNLFEDETSIEIEAGTTSVLLYSINGKFFNLGGTERIKDSEKIISAFQSSFNSHLHNGSNSLKVKATDLDTAGATEGHLLRNVGGLPVWVDPFVDTSPDIIGIRNSDTTTNLNNAAWTVVPLGGTLDIPASSDKLIHSGNTIQVNWTGRVNVRYGIFGYSTMQDSSTKFAVFKNGVQVPGTLATLHIPGYNSSNNADTSREKAIMVSSGDILDVRSILEGPTGTLVMEGNDSFFEVEISTSSMAKGPKGDDGYSGWNYIYGSYVPTTDGSDGDIFQNTTNGNMYKKIAGSWTYFGNILGPIGPTGPKVICLHAERTTSLGNNTYNWSWGAAASNNVNTGIVMPWSGKIIGISGNLSTVGTTASVITVMCNGVTTNKSLTIPASSRDAYVDLSASPYTFSAGARLQLITTTAGTSASNGRMAIFVQLD